jgi:hypothetical protein
MIHHAYKILMNINPETAEPLILNPRNPQLGKPQSSTRGTHNPQTAEPTILNPRNPQSSNRTILKPQNPQSSTQGTHNPQPVEPTILGPRNPQSSTHGTHNLQPTEPTVLNPSNPQSADFFKNSRTLISKYQKQEIQVFTINKGLIFILWYENYHISIVVTVSS